MDLNNLSAQEELFRAALTSNGVPAAETEVKEEFQKLADDAGLTIRNPSKYSAFWVFVKSAVTSPALWLIAFMVRHVMPNMYVKTASGEWLDLLAYAYGVERKPATRAEGTVTFSRVNTSQAVNIPAGTRVRTLPLNGRILRMITLADAVIPAGETGVDVLCIAEEAGSAYNLAEGYYALMDSDVPGVTSVTTGKDYLTTLGADTETDLELRLRIRNQFAAAGDWHTDAKYRAMIASEIGFRLDRIYFKKYDPESYTCRGPGSADAFVLFDSGASTETILEKLNKTIADEGNHGHGDSLLVKELPGETHNVSATVFFASPVTSARRAEIVEIIEQMIECAFRKNQGYTDKVTQTWAYSRFSFSRLGAEIHACYPEEITSIVWGQNDIVTLLAVARLGTLRVVAG